MVKLKSIFSVMTLLFLMTTIVKPDFNVLNKNLTQQKSETSYQAVRNEKEYPLRTGINSPKKQVKVVEKKKEIKAVASNKSKSTVTKTTSKKKTVAAAKKTTPQSRGGRIAAPPSQEKVKIVLGYAKQFLGAKYVFGGASPKGFDCSGFTMYIYKKIGISLPHSARLQFTKGTQVSRENLMPGDLVFFETYKKGISHVGIYIGDNKFLHASSVGTGVTITSILSSYYSPRFKGAVRIIK